MSVVTILAKTKNTISWESLHKEVDALPLSIVEVFPIPMELGFEENGIGIAVPNNYSSKENALSELQRVIGFLESKGFKLIELYNGELITKNNVRDICNYLLPEVQR